MSDVLNLTLKIYRKTSEGNGGQTGTIKQVHGQNLVLKQGDEIRLSIMNVEEIQSLKGSANNEV